MDFRGQQEASLLRGVYGRRYVPPLQGTAYGHAMRARYALSGWRKGYQAGWHRKSFSSCPGISNFDLRDGSFFLFRTLLTSPMGKERTGEKGSVMANVEIPYKIYLSENEIPRQWYNVRADMKKKPAPLIDPSTMNPITLEAMSEVFCEELARQELDDSVETTSIGANQLT